MASSVNGHVPPVGDTAYTVDNNYTTTLEPAHANATNQPSAYSIQDHQHSSTVPTAPLAANPGQYQSHNAAPYPPQNTAAAYATPGTDPAYPPPLNTAPVYETNLNTATQSEPPPPYPGPNPNFYQPPVLTSTPNTVLTNDPSKYPGQLQQPPPAVLQVNTFSQQAPANVTVVRTVQVDAGPRPDNYLACSILSTIFCCLIFGIVAIVFSTQVHSHWAQGRYNEAKRASAQARGWNIAAVTTGLVVIAFNVIRLFAFY